MLNQFREGLRNFGIRRIITEKDFLMASSAIIVLGTIRYYGCAYFGVSCSIYNPSFVKLATQFAISLTAFILAGLAVIISFTDEDFLVQLRELNIYRNIMFVFQYNLYLTGLTAVIGIVSFSYFENDVIFLVFVWIFLYMILSLVEMVDLIVEYGIQKSRYEIPE